MLPPWMIEKLDRERREREERQQPRLQIEIQQPDARPERPEQEPGWSPVVTVQVW
jgi:hypothetical protein